MQAGDDVNAVFESLFFNHPGRAVHVTFEAGTHDVTSTIRLNASLPQSEIQVVAAPGTSPKLVVWADLAFDIEPYAPFGECPPHPLQFPTQRPNMRLMFCSVVRSECEASTIGSLHSCGASNDKLADGRCPCGPPER